MKILVTTQIYENYGDRENPRWKAKGSGEYFIPIPKNAEHFPVSYFIEGLREGIEHDSSGYTETIIHSVLVPDDALSEHEQMQMEFDSGITYPAPIITAAWHGQKH